MLYNSHSEISNKNFLFGIRFFLGHWPSAVALLFGLDLLFWPVAAFPPSYRFLLIVPKEFTGIALLIICWFTYQGFFMLNKRQWRRSNLLLAIVFYGLAILFAIPGSITGTSTYFLVGCYALLHFFDQWLPVGFLPANLRDDSL